MLIAVNKYRNKSVEKYNPNGVDVIPVFDTSDCTTELVNCLDLCSVMLTTKNAMTTKGLVVRNILVLGGVVTLADHCFDFSNIQECDSYVYLTKPMTGSSRTLFVGDTRIRFNEDWHEKCLTVNGIKTIQELAFDINYAFKAFNNIIVRMSNKHKHGNHYEYNWFTVALSTDNELRYWNEDYSVTNDKAFALKLDMASEV